VKDVSGAVAGVSASTHIQSEICAAPDVRLQSFPIRSPFTYQGPVTVRADRGGVWVVCALLECSSTPAGAVRKVVSNGPLYVQARHLKGELELPYQPSEAVFNEVLLQLHRQGLLECPEPNVLTLSVYRKRERERRNSGSRCRQP